jgi:hypothetical protein
MTRTSAYLHELGRSIVWIALLMLSCIVRVEAATDARLPDGGVVELEVSFDTDRLELTMARLTRHGR